MARFDVYTFNGPVPFVLDVQASILSHMDSRVVVPLVPAFVSQKEFLPRLKPVLLINGKEYRMITTDIVAVSFGMLGSCVANLDDQHIVIVDAIDFLLQGF